MVAVTDAGVVSPATKMTPAYAALGHYGWAAVADIRYQSTLSPDLTLEPHNFFVGTNTVPDMTAAPGFFPLDIYSFDKKIDDGLPLSGRMKAYNTTLVGGGSVIFVALAGSSGANSPVCVNSDTTPPQYNTLYRGANPNGLCSLIIKATF
jgi:hypothetical protein